MANKFKWLEQKINDFFSFEKAFSTREKEKEFLHQMNINMQYIRRAF